MKAFMPAPVRDGMSPRSGAASPKLAFPYSRAEAGSPVVALRRFRNPIPVRVHVKQGKPSTLSIFKRGLSGGAVDSCAGPWRTSGGWWESGRLESGARRLTPWDRDEWDVALADGPAYRLFRERHTDKWFLEAVID
jgi:hypothetical protein